MILVKLLDFVILVSFGELAALEDDLVTLFFEGALTEDLNFKSLFMRILPEHPLHLERALVEGHVTCSSVHFIIIIL